MDKNAKDFYQMSLAEIRKYKRYSRRALSEVSGISEESLYAIEKHKQIPKVDTAIVLSKILGITLKEFCHSIGLDISGLPSRDD